MDAMTDPRHESLPMHEAQHSFDVLASPRFEAVVDGIEAFAAWVRSAVTSRG